MLRSLLGGVFGPRPATVAGRRLFQAVASQARNPDLFRLGGVPDTPEGRFESCNLHVVLVLWRLKREGPEASETAQALFDAYLKNLDEGLRDMGVGDLSVGKKMRKLGEAIYGRVKGYDAALAGLPDAEALAALIGRTVFGDAGAPMARPLAHYAARAAAALRAEPLPRVLAAHLPWPEFADVA